MLKRRAPVLAGTEYTRFDDIEPIGESDTCEGGAASECLLSYIRNVAVFTEYYTREMGTTTERIIRNVVKFGTSGEVDLKEGGVIAEGLLVAPPKCSEVEKYQVELNGAIGEALIQQPVPQHQRTKLFFDVKIDNQFLD